MKTKNLFLFVIISLFFTACATTPAPGPEAAAKGAVSVDYDIIAEGNSSHVSVPKLLVIRDATLWQATWRLHSQKLKEKTAPEVDFNKVMVITVFSGNYPAGYGIEIQNVVKMEEQLNVELKLITPPPGSARTPAWVQPFVIIETAPYDGKVDFIYK